MQQFDYNEYLKRNPLLKESVDAGGIETPLLAMLKGQNDDMSFLDGVSDEEFVAALEKLGAKYVSTDTGMGTDYYVKIRGGQKMVFSNENGNWFGDSFMARSFR
jgi:hypothetical protein